MSSLPLPSSLNLGDTDNELLSRRFTTADPEGEPLILDRIPEGATGLYIDLSYDLSEKAQLVRCRHCRPHAAAGNHRRGYVVRTCTGEGFLVGYHCGALHYPDRWGLISGEYTRSRERRDILLRVGELLSGWPTLKAEVQAAARSAVWGIHDLARRRLCEVLPDFEAFLQMRMERYGGDLSVVETYRDVAAEAKRPVGTRGSRPIYRERVRQMGSITGRQFLMGTESLRTAVEQDSASLLSAINDLSHRHGSLDTRQLRHSLQAIDRICGRLSNSMDRVRALNAFFDREHMQRLCFCATDWRKGRRKTDSYFADANGISWIVDGAKKATWNVGLCEIPATPRLDARGTQGRSKS